MKKSLDAIAAIYSQTANEANGFVVVNQAGYYARSTSVHTHTGYKHRVSWHPQLSSATVFGMFRGKVKQELKEAGAIGGLLVQTVTTVRLV